MIRRKNWWTTVQLAATDQDVVIGTTLSSTAFGMCDAIVVVRSGLNDPPTTHPNPSDHTPWEP